MPAAPELDAFSIRVMRLVSPSLHSPAVLDLPEAAAIAEASSSVGQTVSGDAVLSSALKISSSFGTVYVGEVFHCYVSVSNVLQTSIRNVRVKIEMQTNSSRTSLMDNCSVSALPSPNGNPTTSASTTDALSYGPGLNRDYIVKHAIAADGYVAYPPFLDPFSPHFIHLLVPRVILSTRRTFFSFSPNDSVHSRCLPAVLAPQFLFCLVFFPVPAVSTV